MMYLADVSSLKLDQEKCQGCKTCTYVCPHGVFKVENKKASIVDLDMCMECGACQLNCEKGAIFVDAGVGCASALINSMITGGEPTCGCSDDSSSSNGGCC